MKMSALEYEKKSGNIDLSHLKRKSNRNKQNKDLNEEDSLTDVQLAKLARLVAPTNLAPVDVKNKNIRLPKMHKNSSEDWGGHD